MLDLESYIEFQEKKVRFYEDAVRTDEKLGHTVGLPEYKRQLEDNKTLLGWLNELKAYREGK